MASPKVDAGGRAITIMPLFAGFPLLPVKFILEALSIYIVRVYVLYSCNFLKNSTKSVSATESMFSY